MLTKLIIKLITFYQFTLSFFIGNQCRFYPSCSHYTKEAIKIHGLLKGGWIGVKRIASCHPWHEGGYDPVPDVLDCCSAETELEN
jgi:putative membrane protein insertion efficiency factor